MDVNRSYTYRQVNLMNTLRQLWEQHVMQTRSFIISTASNLGDLDLVTKRLLRNPMDFANALYPYYGDKIAGEFEELLRQHLLIAANLVNAAKAGDSRGADEARRKWYQNADQIAAFLARINPYWSGREWKALLYDHLAMTEREATERLKGQFGADIMQYGQIEDQALKMADVMSMGLIKQFHIR